MKTVHVNLGNRSYDILIGQALLEQSPKIFKKHGVRNRIFLLSNTCVFALYGDRLLKNLSQEGFDVTEILIPDGEKYKNLATAENIYTYLIAQRADRFSTLAALGGGVTGDIAGFAAATFLRGIPYIQIPTTLLAQVDSSVGGKTGVNHQLGKNMIGAFYQPFLVSVDTDTLSSLPEREFQSGMYEVIKYGLIYDPDFFEYVEGHLCKIKSHDWEVLTEMISRCCEIKAEITSKDETERDLRRILNFGHTIGHALEAATEFQGLTHGEAVAYGMCAATFLSQRKGWLDEATGRRIIHCIRRLGDLPAVDHVSTEKILDAIQKDKKRQGSDIIFVLLKDLGRATISVDVDGPAIAKAWEQTCREIRSSGR